MSFSVSWMRACLLNLCNDFDCRCVSLSCIVGMFASLWIVSVGVWLCSLKAILIAVFCILCSLFSWFSEALAVRTWPYSNTGRM